MVLNFDKILQRPKKPLKVYQAVEEDDEEPKPKKKRPPTDIRRLDIRVGRVDAVEVHPTFTQDYWLADVVVGDPVTRLVPTKLKRHLKEDEIEEKFIVVVCNMPKGEILGYGSRTEILVAFHKKKQKAELLIPPRGSYVGERIIVKGYEADKTPKEVSMRTVEKVMADLSVNEDKQVLYRGIPLKTEISENYIHTASMTTECVIRNF